MLKITNMRIDINQKKIAIGDKYQIFLNGNPAYKASNELFRLLSVINLFKNDDTRARLTINKQGAGSKVTTTQLLPTMIAM